MSKLQDIKRAFMAGFRDCKAINRQDKDMRDNLSEKQVDRMVEQSFPASDPPSTY